MIRKEVESDVLTESVMKTHCTTLGYNPSNGGPGSCKGGIAIVYTSESNSERAGMELIKLVKNDIKYKTNRATGEGRYTWKGKGESLSVFMTYTARITIFLVLPSLLWEYV